MVGSTFQFERRLGKIRLLLPVAIAVGFVTGRAPLIAVNPHQPIPVEAIDRAPRRVHWNQMMVHSQALALRIAVGEKPALQHLIRRETYTRYDVSWIESRLFHIGEIVLRIAVQFKHTYLD